MPQKLVHEAKDFADDRGYSQTTRRVVLICSAIYKLLKFFGLVKLNDYDSFSTIFILFPIYII